MNPEMAKTAGPENAAYCRDVCDQVGIALVTTDAAFHIRLWNAAAGRMFGASSEQMRGTPVLSIIPLERRSAAERMLHRALECGEGSEFEFEQRDTTGKPREFAVALAPIIDETGNRVGASLCVRDITRRIRLQAEVEESRKMAALGEMAGAIAHHFNNVLGGIVTGIDYAIESRDLAINERVLSQISRSLLRTTALVNGLLAFADGGPKADDLADLTEVVNELADEIEIGVGGTNIRPFISAGNIPVTPVPRVQVLTILRNIVQNAVEAMPVGGELHVSASVDDGCIQLVVRDTGHGMDEATKARIFEPFWTTKGVLCKSTEQATGLGLAIAHGIVRRMRGAIAVESQPGKGTELTVTIPL